LYEKRNIYQKELDEISFRREDEELYQHLMKIEKL
jgi:hypothetical protein